MVEIPKNVNPTNVVQPSEQLSVKNESAYDPFSHRNVQNPSSDTEALANLLNSALGTGILAMPLAFSCGGLWFSFVGTIFVGVICTYCVHILVECAHNLCHRLRKPSLGYASLAESAFSVGPICLRRYSKCARVVINSFLVVSMTGCSCIYNVFIAKNIEQVLEAVTDIRLDIRFYILFLTGPLILINLLRNWKLLAPMSIFSNIFLIIGISITMYYAVIDLPNPRERPAFVGWEKLPIFVGISIFALEGIGVVMSLENDMENPTHFIRCPGVLHIGMGCVTVLYVVFGFCGYLKFGQHVEGSITLNLPHDELLAQSAKIVISIAVLLTHPLQMYVPIQIIVGKLASCCDSSYRIPLDYTVRVILVFLTIILAIAIPDIGPLMTLVGAICLSTLGLIFPAVIEVVTLWDEPGMGAYYWRLWKNIVLLLFGLIAMMTGTYVGVQELRLIHSA